MIWTLIVILVVLWLLGFATNVVGGIIHILLILAVLVLGILVHRIGAGPVLDTLARLAWWQFLLICVGHEVLEGLDGVRMPATGQAPGEPTRRRHGPAFAGAGCHHDLNVQEPGQRHLLPDEAATRVPDLGAPRRGAADYNTHGDGVRRLSQRAHGEREVRGPAVIDAADGIAP